MMKSMNLINSMVQTLEYKDLQQLEITIYLPLMINPTNIIPESISMIA